MAFSDAQKLFEANMKDGNVRSDRAAWNLNQGLKLLTEALDQADRQRAAELSQIRQMLAARAR